MKRKNFYIALCLLTMFIIWTLLVCFVDVRAIGPRFSRVGFSTLNEFVHTLTGTNMLLYEITDWLGLVPIATALGFAIFGLVQLIKRKSLFKVDYNILALGVFYIIVIWVYILFELVIINYRPVLINGYLEASYPSSTTMLVISVMTTAIMQFEIRIKNHLLRKIICSAISIFVAFMVIGRLISGVHWISDIIGGALFSLGIVIMYHYFVVDKL